MKLNNRIQLGFKAGFWHFLGSILIALVIAAVVFGIWFPYPYSEMVGGRELFFLIMTVDVVCGPLLTMVLFNPAKPRRELLMDLSLVIMIQLTALVYGLWTVTQARPLYSVFEVDRFRVVSLADIAPSDWAQAQPPWNQPNWGSPRLIGTRAARDANESMQSIEMALIGTDVAVRPTWWKEFDANDRNKVLRHAKVVSTLRAKLSGEKLAVLNAALKDAGKPEGELRYLPMTSFKSTEWVALIDAQTAMPLAYAPVDGF